MFDPKGHQWHRFFTLDNKIYWQEAMFILLFAASMETQETCA